MTVSLETRSRPKQPAVIGIGSNIGNRLLFCQKAIHGLKSEKKIRILKISSLYETAPVDNLRQKKFFNAVVAIETTLSAPLLLQYCQKIEVALGKKITVPKGPRTIDLDLLFYHNDCLDTSNLTLPHPEIENRLFVLIPLSEIAPDWVHPKHALTIKTLLERLKIPSASAVEKRYSQGWEKMASLETKGENPDGL